jgi:mannitol/fructose-specific phosphotransferase system IIA component (Ntr-type)
VPTLQPSKGRLDDVPEHANDNEPDGDIKPVFIVPEHVSDAEEGLRILAQFSRLMDGEIIEP